MMIDKKSAIEITAKEAEVLLHSLVVSGCGLLYIGRDSNVHAVGHAEAQDGAFRWCTPNPMDQHSVHYVATTSYHIVHGRDLFVASATSPGVYVAPLPEWPSMLVVDYADNIKAWQQVVGSTAATQKAFNTFFDNAI